MIMPHECLKCGKVLEDDSDELLEGCNNCGYKLFVYKGEDADIADSKKDKIVKDVEEFMDDLEKKKEFEERLRDLSELDLESIRVVKDGVYSININKLIDEVPLIVELREGKYYIHLGSLFSKGKNKAISLEELDTE